MCLQFTQNFPQFTRDLDDIKEINVYIKLSLIYALKYFRRKMYFYAKRKTS